MAGHGTSGHASCTLINFKGTNEAHGWLGIRFQTEPMGEPSEIVLHVRMWDKDALLQEKMVPIPVADAIKRRRLFGHAEHAVMQ